MKIAFISTYPPDMCGIAEYTYDLVNGLVEISPSIEVTVYRLLTKQIANLKCENAPGVKIVETNEVAGLVNYKALLGILNRHGEKYDVIHIQHEYSIFPWDESFLNFLAEVRRYCDRLVITMHCVRQPLWYPGIEKYQRRLSELVDAIIVHSTPQELELLSQGVDTSRVYRIPHGTRIARLIPRHEAIAKLNLPIENGQRVIAVQGFLRPDKGLNVLLKAFELISRFRNDVVLLIAGDIQLINVSADFIRMIKELEERGDIVVYRRYLSREEVDLVYSIADVIVFPYVDVGGDVGVSGAFHWALGSFKPVICARVPRLVECYELAPALTFPPQNPAALAERILLVLDMKVDIAQYMKPLVAYAYETQWTNVAKMHYRLYEGYDIYMPIPISITIEIPSTQQASGAVQQAQTKR